jgi:hypothetical protein
LNRVAAAHPSTRAFDMEEILIQFAHSARLLSEAAAVI